MAFDEPLSRNEALLQDLLGADNTFGAPQSRIEAILQNILGANNALGQPQSRNEELLMQILEQGIGGGGVESSDVDFIDYDGKIVKSYTASDFASLEEMPSNPVHEGLTAQGWNWTLADAKEHVAKYGFLDIGQTYITDDEKTRIYITLKERLQPFLGIAVNGTVTVEWGDGTTDTVTGSSVQTVIKTQHTYQASGDYVISLSVEGQMAIVGGTNISALIGNGGDTNTDYVYAACIKKVEIGSKCLISNNAFYRCYGLSAITIPNGLTEIGSAAFSTCNALEAIIFPKGIVTLNSSVTRYCISVEKVSLPKGVTAINDYAFQGLSSIQRISIPDGLTILNGNAFNGNNAVKRINMPTVSGTFGSSVFASCAALEEIIIGDGLSQIGTSAAQGSSILQKITIPASVTSIGSNAFSGSYGMKEIHFKGDMPPTLSNQYVFRYVPTDCIIYVPTGKTAVYQNTENYPAGYTYMEEAS